jgi:hypothetical protein
MKKALTIMADAGHFVIADTNYLKAIGLGPAEHGHVINVEPGMHEVTVKGESWLGPVDRKGEITTCGKVYVGDSCYCKELKTGAYDAWLERGYNNPGKCCIVVDLGGDGSFNFSLEFTKIND